MEVTQQELHQENRDYLQHFLDFTKDDKTGITDAITCTMVQFLMCTRRKIATVGSANNNSISSRQFIQIQIDELRKCVVDLQSALNNLSKDSIQ